MKPAVSLQALADYCPAAVAPALDALLAPLGGMAAFVHPGQKVLLKPNMLAGKAPEKAVTTHPEILRAVIRAARAAGGIVSVGDSPGVGSPEQVARRCGLLSVIEEEGARFAPFAESVRVRVGSGTFHELELARDILDADVVINLPKLKTHQMMGLTCGVKNLFGAVVGMRKVRLHLQAGTDKAFFALMLLELAEHIAPALTIVDAVVAHGGGRPRQRRTGARSGRFSPAPAPSPSTRRPPPCSACPPPPTGRKRSPPKAAVQAPPWKSWNCTARRCKTCASRTSAPPRPPTSTSACRPSSSAP